MKKTFAAKLTAVLLAFVLLAGMTMPAFAAEQAMPEPTWQNVIESITPIGEPWVTLDLMPNGYIFTDYSIPRDYDVTLKDGTTQRVRIPRREVQDLFSDGRHIGHYFDVETANETITLYAVIYLNDENRQQGVFEVGQVVFVPVAYEGKTYDKPYYYLLFSAPCRTEIDDSSFLARLLYPIYAAFQKIILFFEDLRDRLGV